MDTIDPNIIVDMSQQIAELSKKIDALNNPLQRWIPAIVGILSALAAIVVGLISRNTTNKQIKASKEIALSQLETSKEQMLKQLRANVIATSRRQWIELLREKIAEFMAISAHIHDCILNNNEITNEEKTDYVSLRTYIQLMLNEAEDNQKKLLDALDEYNEVCITSVKADENDMKKARSDAIEQWKETSINLRQASRAVMKDTWEKVKSLE